MDAKQAAKLKVGDRVMWENNARDAGKVIDKGDMSVTIEWEDGQVGILHHNDMPEVERAK